MLDSDLAELYGVETKVLNKAVKRNGDRFPQDFMFQLTREESELLRCQFGTSKTKATGGVESSRLMHHLENEMHEDVSREQAARG